MSLSNLTHMMSMADVVAINWETPRIYSGIFLEKEYHTECIPE